MNTKVKLSSKNSLWSRMRNRLSRSTVVQFARRLQTALICGKATNVAVEEEKFLTNHELWLKLMELEHRMNMQTKKLNESSNIERRMIKMAKEAQKSKEQFQRIEEMFDDLLENGKVDSAGKCSELA